MFLQEIPDCLYQWNSFKELTCLGQDALGLGWAYETHLCICNKFQADNFSHRIFWFFSSELVSILHLTRADWEHNTELNWLPALEVSFIHMANILGICPFRSWCVRKIKISFCVVFPDVFFAKGNSCHCHSCKPCGWQHLMSHPAMKFCGGFLFFLLAKWWSDFRMQSIAI